jgi:hypothetical protein
MKRFYLRRDEDLSHVSGTGRVADGVLFSSGWVAIQFNTKILNVETVYSYRCIKDMLLVHGHKGKTRIVWIDQDDEEE